MNRSVTLLTAGLLLGACGGDPIAGGTFALNFNGVFAGEDGTEAGNFTVTVSLEDSSGTGFFRVNGESHPFTDLYYDGTSFIGSDADFTFTGIPTDSVVNGSYTSPTGGGLFTGLRRFGSSSPASYCGTHIGARDGVPIAGPYSFVQGEGIRRGVFTSVLAEPFRGQFNSTASATTVVLGALTGDATLTVSGSAFSGDYAMLAGDTGEVAGSICPSAAPPRVGSVYDGVLGGFTGVELGTLSFDLSSTGVGSIGSYRLGGSTIPFLAVISGVNNQVAAFDTDLRLIASLDTEEIFGTYARPGSLGGRIAALHRPGTTPPTAYCGSNAVNGVLGAFAFVARGDSTLFGAFTGGSVGSAFQGRVRGKIGDNLSTMETVTLPATVLASPTSFSGVFTLTGGATGSLNGATCD